MNTSLERPARPAPSDLPDQRGDRVHGCGQQCRDQRSFAGVLGMTAENRRMMMAIQETPIGGYRPQSSMPTESAIAPRSPGRDRAGSGDCAGSCGCTRRDPARREEPRPRPSRTPGPTARVWPSRLRTAGIRGGEIARQPVRQPQAARDEAPMSRAGARPPRSRSSGRPCRLTGVGSAGGMPFSVSMRRESGRGNPRSCVIGLVGKGKAGPHRPPDPCSRPSSRVPSTSSAHPSAEGSPTGAPIPRTVSRRASRSTRGACA